MTQKGILFSVAEVTLANQSKLVVETTQIIKELMVMSQEEARKVK